MQRDRKDKRLYDASERLSDGSVFYSIYSEDRCSRVEVLVLDDGEVRNPSRYQVNSDFHPYPAATAGDHRYNAVPQELEARAATLLAVLEATAPEQRTALPPVAPDIERKGDPEADAEAERIARREKAIRMMEEREARIARSRGMERDQDDGPER